MSEWITVVEMSKKTNIPQETVKRYMSMHEHLLRMKKEHGTYQLHEDCFDVLTKIRELYKQGKMNEEVDKLLTSSGTPMMVDVASEADEIVSADMSKVVADIKVALEEQKQASSKQKELNKILLNLLKTHSEKLDAPQKYIEDSVKRRDEQLMESLRISQKAKKLSLSVQASEKEEKKESWFKRIFK
ncbi:MerR family transcriptional regulator [Domibacillus mangrovi]|uniref:Uncharacterized protein n=1 Tax=Domibacillus mangrovi TaxID=1714354 RepID=A0A1Q5P1C1_9BACI|nr:MerR family transcriptional regulator [Domibacillus mangrovi]OKL35991.1 hypothetical protein BLL40_11705 [Domibacillus mangrovi]